MRAILLPVLLVLAVPAAAETLTVSGDDCRRAVRHVADADVAYRPGVDVTGAAVAPADLPGGPRLAVGSYVAVPITVDLGRRLGLPRRAAAEAVVGVVEFHDGRFWFDGQPLEDAAEAELVARCREAARPR